MTPKFRAWIKTENCFADYIESIRFYINEIDLCWGGICESDCFDFKDVILMQSTDMVDRDGKIIFEGDIVKMSKDVYSEPTYYEVVRHYGGAYRLESKQHGCELWLRHADCVVVGNIYENKELLDA
ncbi:YopX family protein [Streptococcus mitis]|jgi:hypothetical protein|uniref:YopX family protein n=1 Tax=Streptococcus mitis TaxID=28037 RepID=UPI00206D78D4|nr:YopX family protein [Streptococcus mitis]DAN53883.1 MAG TPA: YopX protein [Caudoviricetes sp.]DAO12615.1 MAG TPA: YopX protein [Caudoviricetes sp.]